MASNNVIGDYLVRLGVKSDIKSFETGNKYIDGITSSFNKLIATARNAAVVLTTTAVASGAIENQAYKTSQKLGMSTEALDTWKAAAKIAGVNANSLIGSMAELSNMLSKININGEGVEQYAEKLQYLKMSIKDLKDEEGNWLSTEEAYTKIIREAQRQYDEATTPEGQRDVITRVGMVLGDSGQDFFIKLEQLGTTIDQFIAGAGNTVFTTGEDNANGQGFIDQVNKLKTTLESMSLLLGDEVGQALTPYVDKLNKWLIDNKDEITAGIKRIGDGVETIAAKVKSIATFLGAGVEKVIDATENVVDEFKTAAEEEGAIGVAKEAAKVSLDATTKIMNPKQMVVGAAVTVGAAAVNKIKNLDDEQKDNAKNKFTNWLFGNNKKKKDADNEINDGIMRPDGTVTRVAPNDWVFAAKDIGNLARAFIPQNYASAAPSVYTINQTFNVSGSRDLPQTLKQQAFKGAQEGLMQKMAQSSQRLQMMSGTR